jgi:hypothetical protein
MRLHPASLAVGAALMVGVGILSAQNIVGTPTIEVRAIEPVVTYSPAHPKNFVRVEMATPYVVPSERILVLTALGWNDGGSYAHLLIDGNIVFLTTSTLEGSIQPIVSPGIVAQSGQTVSVTSNQGEGVALGYLADK